MRLMVLGAGRMGGAIAYDLAKAKGKNAVCVVDGDRARAERVGKALGVEWRAADLADERALDELLRGVDVTVVAADYSLNEGVTRACIRAKSHMCDLGGNIHVVARQLAMTGEAEAAGVTIIPDCGLAPGLATWLGYRASERVKNPERVSIRVGGLPQHPKPPLNYSLFFSVRGLTNEYLEPCEVLRGGELARVEAMTEIESLRFPAPFGELEAFHTSGGASTLVTTLAGRVKELDYKTIRYKGHCTIIKAMIDLGFLSEEPVHVGGVMVAPRPFTEAVFERSLQHGDDDAVLVRAYAEGGGERFVYELVDRKDPATQHSAMMRTTGYPTAVAALFLADGRISQRGVLPGERCVPVDDLVDELRERGIDIQTRVEKT